MSPGTSNVSIIIPCHNAARNIKACLEGLLIQDHPRYEIIVVDDASDDGTEKIVMDMARVKLVRNTSNRGPAYARNEGARAALGELLLFIDSDTMTDDPGLVSKHAEAHREKPGSIVGGGIEGVGKGAVAAADKYSHWFLNIPNSNGRVGSHLVTNNLSVGKAVFDKLRGFREDLRTGEDTDFCERALKAGYRLVLKPDAIIKHCDRERFADFMDNFYKVGIDRIEARRTHKHRYWFLLPWGRISSILYCVPLALLLSLQIMLAWFPYDKRVVLYLPLIIAGRLAMTAGIVRYYFTK